MPISQRLATRSRIVFDDPDPVSAITQSVLIGMGVLICATSIPVFIGLHTPDNPQWLVLLASCLPVLIGGIILCAGLNPTRLSLTVDENTQEIVFNTRVEKKPTQSRRIAFSDIKYFRVEEADPVDVGVKNETELVIMQLHSGKRFTMVAAYPFSRDMVSELKRKVLNGPQPPSGLRKSSFGKR